MLEVLFSRMILVKEPQKMVLAIHRKDECGYVKLFLFVEGKKIFFYPSNPLS